LSTVENAQLAQLNSALRTSFGGFNRASAFPAGCCGVSERIIIIRKDSSLHLEDSLQLAAGNLQFDLCGRISVIGCSILLLEWL